MKIYAIWDVKDETFIGYGTNGGGRVSYCKYRGEKCFFFSRSAAENVIGTFDNPKDYKVATFILQEDKQ